jgi:nucleotide-binding universal stress UspA family protein
MDSLILQSNAQSTRAAPAPGGTLKSVLLHVQDDPGLEARLQAALAIVRATGGHLECLQVTPMLPLAGYPDFGGAFVLTSLSTELAEREAALRERIEARLGKEDVAWSYKHQTWNPAAALIHSGALADLIVLGRFHHSQGSDRQTLALFGDVLGASRSPMLICPKDPSGLDPFGPAVVAWNASLEAANALRAALPLLHQASAVHVVAVGEKQDLDFPPLDAAEYLSRHGIHAEMIEEHAGTLSVPDRLIATAASLSASYLVMGAYGHSRAREYLFGGVTRSVLQDCPLPLVIAR